MDRPAMQHRQNRSRRVLMRGESAIASSGLLLAAIVLFAMGGSAWWSARSQQQANLENRGREVRMIGNLVSELTATLLAVDRVAQTRLIVADAVTRYDLAACRVVLPDGQVIAAGDATEITLASLPESWQGAQVPGTVAAPAGDIVASYPFVVAGRGSARLDIAADVDQPLLSLWTAQAGIGIVCATALFAVLLVYRRMRSRMRALSFIRESLLALDAGETALAALTIQNDLGAEAMAWNELLTERESLQQVLVTKRLLELPSARQERSHDLTSMCDAMSQGLILVDKNLLITYANGAAGLYLGTTREQILGTNIESTVDDARILGSIRGVAAGTLRRSSSTEIQHQDGDSRGVLRFNVRPVRKDDESAAMIVIEDVTQQRLADDARNTFVAAVAHELRTPLTNILMYAETAMEAGEEDVAGRARSLNVINQEARRLERVVGDMLSVAEIEAGTHEVRLDDVPLVTLFEDLRHDYAAAAKEKSLELVFDLPPKLPVIQADRDKLTLAIHNLVGNALKYTPNGGMVTVEVDCTEEAVTVKVIDTGIGMSAPDRERIFEKFYRANDERIAGITGSGLGLALARDVIRLHGGDIVVESEIDEGSTFTLTVPILAATAA